MYGLTLSWYNHHYIILSTWQLSNPGEASQRKSCVAISSGKISKDPYRVGCIDENYTLSTHFLYTLISQIHTKKWTFKGKHPFHTFYEMVGFNPPPLSVCTHFHTSLSFQTPLSTRKFGLAGYSTFSSTRLPGHLTYPYIDPDYNLPLIYWWGYCKLSNVSL